MVIHFFSLFSCTLFQNVTACVEIHKSTLRITKSHLTDTTRWDYVTPSHSLEFLGTVS